MTGHIPAESTNACPTSPTTDQPELLPCPFCGGGAKRFTIEEEGDNFGGDVIACTGICGASSHVEFGRKENLVSLWNTRLTSTTPTLGDMAKLVDRLTDLADTAKRAVADSEGLADHKLLILANYGDLALQMAPAFRAALSAAPASPIPTSVNGAVEREVNEARRLLTRILVAANRQRRSEITSAEFQEYAMGLLLPALSPALDNTAVEGQREAMPFHEVLRLMRETMESHSFWRKAVGTPLENDLPVRAANIARALLQEAATCK
jgi:hypothetical protein